jgi:hypothetical protein
MGKFYSQLGGTAGLKSNILWLLDRGWRLQPTQLLLVERNSVPEAARRIPFVQAFFVFIRIHDQCCEHHFCGVIES